jgi:hypothetical protein
MPLTEEQRKEIAAERSESRPTRRVTVPALEEILYEPIPVLDHGFVRVMDYMGDDSAIVQGPIRNFVCERGGHLLRRPSPLRSARRT